jgi:hypothetical protein
MKHDHDENDEQNAMTRQMKYNDKMINDKDDEMINE